MGGELTVVSSAGRGQHVQLHGMARRRRSAGASRDARRRRGRSKRAPRAGCDVLLAEDNPVNQKVAQPSAREGRPPRRPSVDTGAAAVDAVRRERFDVVLMDVQMPEMNGFEATQAIRAMERDGARMPIVALTAHAMRGDDERCLEAGMDGYVSKPVRPQELYAAIERALGSPATRRDRSGAAGCTRCRTAPLSHARGTRSR